ncbi:MAG: hypothetical protein HY422_02375 [Candidatus Komeilibacteria bacterium]|nr:hypothetical protein [Candidatus Komeilibacteria bacterium]
MVVEHASTTLPVTERLIAADALPKSAHCMLITHVLPTSVDFIEALNKLFPVQRIIAIPYSYDRSAVAALRKKNFRVLIPKSLHETFRVAQKQASALLKASSHPLIIQEVGGYLADFTSDLSIHKHFLGIVEDTNAGHWRYEARAPHLCPILSIAQSEFKAVEDTLIGDAAVYSIERIVREDFRATIQGLQSGVIGFGKIGTSSAIALRGRESAVSIFDVNPSRLIKAKVEGFFSRRSLTDLLQECNLVVGCTGKTSIFASDVPSIRTGAILASASSKDVEFDIAGFGKLCSAVDLNDAVRRYTKANGDSFYLLHKGFPINFRDFSIIGPALDLIYGELVTCMRHLRDKRVSNGLHRSTPEIQAEVANTWLEVYGEN